MFSPNIKIPNPTPDSCNDWGPELMEGEEKGGVKNWTDKTGEDESGEFYAWRTNLKRLRCIEA